MKLPFLPFLPCVWAACRTVRFSIPEKAPAGSGMPFDGFVSYSIESWFLPDFAGNNSLQNVFTNNLLNNIEMISGTRPHIRVGGNTQDSGLFDPSLQVTRSGILEPGQDHPEHYTYGPAFFESIKQLPRAKFTWGFNLGLSGNNSEGFQALLDTLPSICNAFSPENLDHFEYGNEPDFYPYTHQNRPLSWNEDTWVDQWLNGTRAIRSGLQELCPKIVNYKYIAPSLALPNFTLNATLAWEKGLNEDRNIDLWSGHNYMGSSRNLGITLQGTLMNHTHVKNAISNVMADWKRATRTEKSPPPFIFGETNSLARQGLPGTSNTFGAGLWALDFNLYCASQDVKRVFMHQGLDYRYASWQPLQTNKTAIGTKAPYYGQVAAAQFLGKTKKEAISVHHIPQSSERLAAYAVYSHGQLARLMLINLQTYNTTVNGLGLEQMENPPKRQAIKVALNVEKSSAFTLHRLIAPGSDAITSISWDGWSYNYELDHGKAVKLANVTTGEILKAKDGAVVFMVPDATAVMLSVRH